MADDDDDFAAMFAASEKDKPRAAKRPKIGDMVKGKIVSVTLQEDGDGWTATVEVEKDDE